MIYRGYAIFRRCEGRIVEVSEADPNYHGGLARVGKRQFIKLSLQDSLDEQLRTLVHEFLHLGYEYGTTEWHIIPGHPIPRELGISKKQAVEYLENIEDLIERETEKVLQTQPVLVNHLRELIIKSSKYPKL